MKPKCIIHGGAWNIPEPYESDHIEGIKKALMAVYPQLLKGISAIDAVEMAVNVLEEDPTYDAGRGAFLNAQGEIELDAIIVDGRNIDFGAVAGIKDMLHPVSVARAVMDHTEHCFLIGQGANEFALRRGFEEMPVEELLTARELEYYWKIKNDPHFLTHLPFDHPSDTVGAVVLDVNGNIAAATSTGGTPRKMAGRVGDSPLLGAGAYADNTIGGVSTTGWGESIMRSLLAKRTIDLLEDLSPEEAVEKSLAMLKDRFNGLAGMIGITASGEYFKGYNTPKMAYGYIEDDGTIITHIRKNE